MANDDNARLNTLETIVQPSSEPATGSPQLSLVEQKPLTILERELDRLLLHNYDLLTERNGKRCKQLLIEYVLRTESVQDKEFAFIKRLTKVGTHVLTAQTYVKGLGKKLYDFNLEGIAKIDAARYQTSVDERLEHAKETGELDKLAAHLYAHAGHAIHKEFVMTQNPSYAQLAYKARIKAYELSPPSKFAFYCASYAAGDAFHLFRLARQHKGPRTEEHWAKECLRAAKHAEETYRLTDERDGLEVALRILRQYGEELRFDKLYRRSNKRH